MAAEEVTGYSGEDVPVDAPTNLMLNEVVGPRSAILSWNPVKPESVRGDFKVITVLPDKSDKELQKKSHFLYIFISLGIQNTNMD